MSNPYRSTDYLYAGARIRAKESSLVGKSTLLRLAELPSSKEILDALVADGVLEAKDAADRETALLSLWRGALDCVKESIPDPGLAAFLQYPYDCHNLKSILKCRKKGCDPAPLLLDAGTLPAAAYLSAAKEGLPEGLPRNMATAAGNAMEAFARTGNPQEIDFILDAACFEDMKSAAAPLPFARDFVGAKATLTNLSTCRRLILMRSGTAGEELLKHAYLPAGAVTLDALLSLYKGGMEAFSDYISHSPYFDIFKGDTKEIERRRDNYCMELARRAHYIPFGPEVAVGYLIGMDFAVKNLRILLTGKDAGLDANALKERLRASYV